MKPIIIKVDKEGYVTMSVEEFQKYMDDAYYQGIKDGEDRKWWKYIYQTTPVPVYKTTITGTEGSTIDARNVCTTGTTDASTTATVYNPDTPSTKTI